MAKNIKEVSLSQQHWNGCQMVAIDVETTGTDSNFHELIQLCIMPLDANFNVRKDVIPFYLKIIPDHPDRADKKAMATNKLNFTDISSSGFDREAAKDLMEDWIKKLKLPFTKYNVPCKMIPLGHGYCFDRSFISRWLGEDMYNEYFHPVYRDTMQTAAFLNDTAAQHAERVPFSKQTLNWLCHQMSVSNEGAHDALIDCLRTAQCYKQLTIKGLL